MPKKCSRFFICKMMIIWCKISFTESGEFYKRNKKITCFQNYRIFKDKKRVEKGTALFPPTHTHIAGTVTQCYRKDQTFVYRLIVICLQIFNLYDLTLSCYCSNFQLIRIRNLNKPIVIYITFIQNRTEQNQKRGIRFPQLAKITTLFSDWLRSLNQKKG